MTPPATEPDVPIVEELLPSESMAPETERTHPSASVQVTTLAVTLIETEVSIVGPLTHSFSSLAMLTEGNFQ